MRGAAGDQPLWIRDSGNAVAAHASADVENLHGVVSQRQLVFPVKAEMVEASLDTRHGNRFGQDPRSRRFGLGGFLSVQSKRERSEEHTSDSSHTVISYAVFCLKQKRSRLHYSPRE